MIMIRKGICKTILPAIMLCILTVAAGCSSNTEKVGPKIRNVQVKKAVIGAISINEEYAGTVKPLQEVNVASTIGGRVEKVYYDVGDSVKQGEVLFTLKADAQQVTSAEAGLSQAQLQYNYARDNYQRMKALFDQGAISQQALDEAETNCQSAQVTLNNARENLGLVSNNAGGRGNLTVTAPISGIISACNIDAGEMTSASVTAFTIMKPDAMYVEIGVSDQVIKKIIHGQKLKVIINAMENTAIDGWVDQISPNADALTKLYKVRIILPQAEPKISAGMIAKVMIPVEQKPEVLQVPNQAIVVEQGKSMVYTVANDTVHKKNVQTGIASETMTEITGNLNKDDLIVIEGQHLLQEGEKVHIVLSK